jgi:hypothetical protein
LFLRQAAPIISSSPLSEFGANREYGIVDYYNQPETVVFPVVKKPAGESIISSNS